jgi:hypothetical protein
LIGRITDKGVVPNLDLAIEYLMVLNVREILDVRKIKTSISLEDNSPNETMR